MGPVSHKEVEDREGVWRLGGRRGGDYCTSGLRILLWRPHTMFTNGLLLFCRVCFDSKVYCNLMVFMGNANVALLNDMI